MLRWFCVGLEMTAFLHLKSKDTKIKYRKSFIKAGGGGDYSILETLEGAQNRGGLINNVKCQGYK